MHYNMEYVVKDLHDLPMLTASSFDPDGKATDTQPLTARLAICEALMGQYRDEQLTAADKVARYELARYVMRNTIADFNFEEVVLIKELVNKNYSTAVVGALYDFFEKSGKAGSAGEQQT